MHATESCFVTMVSLGLEPLAPIHWESPLAPTLFTPNILLPSLAHVESSSKFDVVLLSVSNLQSFQNVCAQLEPLLHLSSIIAVESTGYVQLEPFVLSSFSRAKGLSVCSIMNESEVKRLPNSNTFCHRVLNGDQRIYLGTCTDESTLVNRVSESDQYSKLYKLLQMVQADLHSYISLLKSNNHKEFMTYQWKLALPRIILNPLSVIFEEPFFEKLGKQILAKPLITGLVNEIFKIIKKMECKLIKGFENESSICKNWLVHYPEPRQPLDPLYLETNPTFYNMYYNFDMELDLLLLQPILLGDDHDVRTPYLENLYSIMCQVQTWSRLENSIFFSRKFAGSENTRKDIQLLSDELAALQLEKQEAENSKHERLSILQQLDESIRQKRESKDRLSKDMQDKSLQLEMNLRQLFDQQASKLNELRELEAAIAERQSRLAQLDRDLSLKNTEKSDPLKLASLAIPENDPVFQQSVPAQQKQRSPSQLKVDVDQQNKKLETAQDATKIQALQTPDMSEFSDIAVYGAEMNGDMQTPRVPSSTSQQGNFSQNPPPNPEPNVNQQYSVLELKEKELELERRERALLDRERTVNTSSHPGTIEQYEHGDQIGNSYPNQAKYSNPLGHSNPPGFNNTPSYNNTPGYSNAPAHSNNPGYNNNPGHSNNPGYSQMNGGTRHTFSLTGNSPYTDGNHQADGYQGNGHFLHSGPPSMRNNPRYHQGGQPFNQIPPQPSRRGSQGNMQNLNYPMQGMAHAQQMQIPSQQMQMPSQQMQRYNGQPPMQGMPTSKHQSMGSQHFMMNQAVQGNPGGFPPKKPNRRSAFPDQAVNIDYGGRAGMAMTNAGPKPRNGAHTSPILPQQRKSTMGFPQASHAINGGGQLLRPPTQNGSSNSLGSEQNTPNSHTPEPHNEVKLEVPTTATAGVPLGSIAPENPPKGKKKRGFLKKS